MYFLMNLLSTERQIICSVQADVSHLTQSSLVSFDLPNGIFKTKAESQ